MQYEAFIERVRERAELEDLSEAVRATEATLETLGERLPPSRKALLADDLPTDLAEALYLRRYTEGFGLETFYERVRALAEVEYPVAVQMARAVMDTLREAVPPETFAAIRAALPYEYGELFGEPTWSPGQ